MELKNLEQILAYEKEHRCENGPFGIKACKESIQHDLAFDREHGIKSSLFTYLERYYYRAQDTFFNKAMILACWELINGKWED